MPSFSIATLYIVKSCENMFAIRFPLYVPKMGFWESWEWTC